MSAASELLEEVRAADQRRFMTLVGASMTLHVGLVALASLTDVPARAPTFDVVRVDLVALPAGAPSVPKAAAKAPPKAPAASRTAPVPPKTVLPKEAPAAVPKRPRKVAAPPAPVARPERLAYDDALAQLRDELGEDTPSPTDTVSTGTASTAGADAPEASGSLVGGDARGRTVDPMSQAWQRDVARHLQQCWVMPPEFSNRGLSTGLEVRLSRAGDVLGTPRVERSSGDPFYDDNAIRAVVGCTPLPAPPAGGSWRFAFTAERP